MSASVEYKAVAQWEALKQRAKSAGFEPTFGDNLFYLRRHGLDQGVPPDFISESVGECHAWLIGRADRSAANDLRWEVENDKLRERIAELEAQLRNLGCIQAPEVPQ